MRRKKALFVTLGIVFVLLLAGCGAVKNEISMDDWTTLSLEDGNGTALNVTIPPELAENAGKILKNECGWGAHYDTDYSNFRIYVSIFESDYSEDLLHTVMGSDVQYMSEDMFEKMQVSSFFSAPESEKGEKTIHDINWKYYSLSGSTKKKAGGSVSACEYGHLNDGNFVHVVIMYSAKNEAPKEEKDLLENWYELIPETMEFETPAE